MTSSRPSGKDRLAIQPQANLDETLCRDLLLFTKKSYTEQLYASQLLYVLHH